MDGTLQVSRVRDGLVVEKRSSDIGGTSVTTLRFGYRQNPDRLTRFTGAYVKNSAVLGKIVTVEYVPLMVAYSERTLDCAVRLPGVDEN